MAIRFKMLHDPAAGRNASAWTFCTLPMFCAIVLTGAYIHPLLFFVTIKISRSVGYILMVGIDFPLTARIEVKPSTGGKRIPADFTGRKLCGSYRSLF